MLNEVINQKVNMGWIEFESEKGRTFLMIHDLRYEKLIPIINTKGLDD